MVNTKFTNVFFDIETLQTNTGAKNAKDYVVREYSVSMEYKVGSKYKELLFPSLKTMLDYLVNNTKNKKFRLIAHNGRSYDFHFLRRTLIDCYGFIPVTGFKDDYVEHDDGERKEKDLLVCPNLIIEYRIKAKTKLDLVFMINGKTFVTEDSYPHFQTSIKTLGGLLVHHGIIKKDDQKLDYDYDRYNTSIEIKDVRGYCDRVFRGLTEHERHYVRNDTHILRMAWDNYEILFPGFDIGKKTLSLNILSAYSINPLAKYQLTRSYKSVKKEKSLCLSDFDFMGTNMFAYIHEFYHGGLNFYNDKLVATTVNNLVHIDINSSYPTVMYNEKFPTWLAGYVDKKKVVGLDDEYYYMLQVPVTWLTDSVLDKIPSINVRKMIVKRFPSKDGYVFLQSPDIEIFSQFMHKEIKAVPVKSALWYIKRRFGGRLVIDEKYKLKTQAKQEGWSKNEVYVTKVILNGLYGIPALRAYFGVFKYVFGELVSCPYGYKNSERNILFAAAVTSYAFRNLLMPLTFNVEGLDRGYVYTDTDSHFLTKEYWETIKDHVKIHPTDLGAWDLEHKHIKSMYVLNHKKYCLLNDNNEIEVFSGGIPHEAFNTDMDFDEFVKTQFHDGAEIDNLKNTYTKDGVICLHMSQTKITKGGEYQDHYSDRLEKQREYWLCVAAEAFKENPLDDALFVETPAGTFGASDFMQVLYNKDGDKHYPISELIRMDGIIKDEIDRI